MMIVAAKLMVIMEKLQSILESMVDRLVKTVGLPLVRKISGIAVNWGNQLASKWTEDHAFPRYVAFNVAKNIGLEEKLVAL